METFGCLRRLENRGGFFCLSAATFLLVSGYEMLRAVTQSAVVSAWGADGLPYAWLLTATLVLPATWSFNRMISRTGVTRMFCGLTLLVMGATAIFRGWLPLSPRPASLLCYAWKDIYMVLLAEQIWALANATFRDAEARKLYGLFTVSGSLGALAGNWLVKEGTGLFGAYNLFLGSLVPHFLLLFLFAAAAKRSTGIRPLHRPPAPGAAPAFPADSGLALFHRHRFLPWLLALVVLIQLSLSLLDFSVSRLVEREIAGVDARTVYFSGLYFYTNVLAFLLQFLVMSLALTRFGVFATLATIPLLLLAGCAGLAISPSLLLASLVFLVLKGSDFSLLRGAREVLYLPVSLEAKYKAKAVIDVWAYRSAKILSSFALLALKAKQGEVAPFLNSYTLLLGTVLLWFLILLPLRKRWHGEFWNPPKFGPPPLPEETGASLPPRTGPTLT